MYYFSFSYSFTQILTLKHKRTQKTGEQYNYELANLKNVLYSLSALYLLLYKMKQENSENSEIKFESELFDIDYI